MTKLYTPNDVFEMIEVREAAIAKTEELLQEKKNKEIAAMMPVLTERFNLHLKDNCDRLRFNNGETGFNVHFNRYECEQQPDHVVRAFGDLLASHGWIVEYSTPQCSWESVGLIIKFNPKK